MGPFCISRMKPLTRGHCCRGKTSVEFDLTLGSVAKAPATTTTLPRMRVVRSQFCSLSGQDNFMAQKFDCILIGCREGSAIRVFLAVRHVLETEER